MCSNKSNKKTEPYVWIDDPKNDVAEEYPNIIDRYKILGVRERQERALKGGAHRESRPGMSHSNGIQRKNIFLGINPYDTAGYENYRKKLSTRDLDYYQETDILNPKDYQPSYEEDSYRKEQEKWRKMYDARHGKHTVGTGGTNEGYGASVIPGNPEFIPETEFHLKKLPVAYNDIAPSVTPNRAPIVTRVHEQLHQKKYMVSDLYGQGTIKDRIPATSDPVRFPTTQPKKVGGYFRTGEEIYFKNTGISKVQQKETSQRQLNTQPLVKQFDVDSQSGNQNLFTNHYTREEDLSKQITNFRVQNMDETIQGVAFRDNLQTASNELDIYGTDGINVI
ncbi:MAG: hypothetical protein N2B06_00515 [Clostridium sp.]